MRTSVLLILSFLSVSLLASGKQSPTENQLLTAELDMDVIDEVRNLWQFYRDRRPDTYDVLTAP